MKKLLLILLFFAHAGSLHGMELEKKLSPITLLQTYQYFSHVLCSDTARLIYSFQFNNNLAEFLENIDNSYCCCLEFPVKHIEALVSSCGYVLAKKICEYYFKKAKRSITNCRDVKNRTCLFFTNNPEVVQIFIDIAGDDADKLVAMRKHHGETALHRHVNCNNTKIVELILNTAGKKAYNLLAMENFNYNYTALHFAAYGKNTQITKLLLNAAGDKVYDLLMKQKTDCLSAFHWAIEENNIEFIKLVLDAIGEKKYNLFFEQEFTKPVFHYAVEHKNIEIITLLLNAAGDKAQDLILMQDSRSDFTDNPVEYTPFEEATPEIREILKTYMERDKVTYALSQIKKAKKYHLEQAKKSKKLSKKSTEKSNCLIS